MHKHEWKKRIVTKFDASGDLEESIVYVCKTCPQRIEIDLDKLYDPKGKHPVVFENEIPGLCSQR